MTAFIGYHGWNLVRLIVLCWVAWIVSSFGVTYGIRMLLQAWRQRLSIDERQVLWEGAMFELYGRLMVAAGEQGAAEPAKVTVNEDGTMAVMTAELSPAFKELLRQAGVCEFEGQLTQERFSDSKARALAHDRTFDKGLTVSSDTEDVSLAQAGWKPIKRRLKRWCRRNNVSLSAAFVQRAVAMTEQALDDGVIGMNDLFGDAPDNPFSSMDAPSDDAALIAWQARRNKRETD